MVLTLSDFQDRFRKIGRMIYVGQLAAGQQLAYRRAAVALVDEVASAEAALDWLERLHGRTP